MFIDEIKTQDETQVMAKKLLLVRERLSKIITTPAPNDCMDFAELQKIYDEQTTHFDRMQYFLDNSCQGREYDSCVNSPCPFASTDGCKHPEHPKNKEKSE